MRVTVLGACGAWPEAGRPGMLDDAYELRQFEPGEGLVIGPVPEDSLGYLSGAADAGRQAGLAGAGRVWLTHLWPGSDPGAAIAAAREDYDGGLDVAVPGLRTDV